MTIIRREEWGAQHGRGNATAGAKLHLYVHHSADDRVTEASTTAQEHAVLQAIEHYHARLLTPSNPRIGYTYLIAPSGRIYEGTGRGRVGAHTAGRNSSGYGVCLLMDGRKGPPTPAMLEAFDWLRDDLVRSGDLHRQHDLLGHRDVVATECPGDHVYQAIVRGIRRSAPVVVRAAAIAPMPTLRKGSGGSAAPADLREAVRELQRRLGMSDRHRTGFFGDITDTAVRDYQRRHGLLADGIVGRLTWAALGGAA